MRAEIPFGQREFFLKSSRPSFLIKRAALGNLKAAFIALIGIAFSHERRHLSKTYLQWSLHPLRFPRSRWTETFLTLKEGSTSHLGLLPSGKKRKTALRCSEPLRFMVVGPSKVFARFCGMGTPGERGRQKNIIVICLFALVLFSSFYHRLHLVEQDIERI